MDTYSFWSEQKEQMQYHLVTRVAASTPRTFIDAWNYRTVALRWTTDLNSITPDFEVRVQIDQGICRKAFLVFGNVVLCVNPINKSTAIFTFWNAQFLPNPYCNVFLKYAGQCSSVVVNYYLLDDNLHRLFTTVVISGVITENLQRYM